MSCYASHFNTRFGGMVSLVKELEDFVIEHMMKQKRLSMPVAQGSGSLQLTTKGSAFLRPSGKRHSRIVGALNRPSTSPGHSDVPFLCIPSKDVSSVSFFK